MKNKQRKGFTIVELVIVIAIIAILAAVLIPTFSNVIYKAKVSKDTQLIRNLNTALAADNKEHNTMHDAVLAAADFGYSLEKIDASATDNKILWDSANDVFCYYVKGSTNPNEVEYIPDTQLKTPANELDPVNYWIIADELPTTPLYSIYAGAGWNEEGDHLILARSLEEGFDAGTKSVNEVTYVGTKHVTIRTNNDTAVVTVNNAAAEVDFYGTAGKISVVSAASNSVHIYGEVTGNVEVTSGHVVIESKATVSAVVAMANTAKITVQPGATCTVATKEGVTLPEGAITGADSTVTVNPDTMSKFAGGLGTKESPYLIANSTQFKYIHSLYIKEGFKEATAYTGKEYYFKQTEDIVISSDQVATDDYVIYGFTGTYDGNDKTISYDENVSALEFGRLFYCVFNNTVFKNIRYELKSNQPFSFVFRNDWSANTADLTFENVTIDSNNETVLANTSNFGLFGSYTTCNFNSVKFVNCTNNANLNNQGTSTGVFVGSGYYLYVTNPDAKVVYQNCKNTGTIQGACYVGILYGNPSYVGIYDENGKVPTEKDYRESQINKVDVKNEGMVISLKADGIAAFAPNSARLNKDQEANGTYHIGDVFKDVDTFVKLDGVVFKTNLGNDSGYKYKLAISVHRIDSGASEQSNTTKYFLNMTTDATITETSISTFYAIDKERASELGLTPTYENGIAIAEKDGVGYLVLENEKIGRNNAPFSGTKGQSGVAFFVYAYNDNGVCVGVKTIK